MWDAKVASWLDMIEDFFSITVLLNVKVKGSWRITCAYGLVNPRCRPLFWEEPSFIFGLCHPH